MYYKKLGLTPEDVLNEPDIERVKEWQKAIEADLAEFKASMARYDVLKPGQKRMDEVLYAFSKLCRKRIAAHCLELKEQGLWKTRKDRKQERVFSVAFQQAARETLPKETYDAIVALANKKINESSENE